MFLTHSIRRIGYLALVCLTLAAHAQEPPVDDILPPRGPVEIPVPPAVSYTPWILGGVALVAAGFAWWWFRRPAKVIVIAPLERALTDLGVIDRERNQLDPAPLAEQAAYAVRRFIAARHGIAAPQRTTEEFLQSLTTSPSPALTPHVSLLQSFLTSCDMAKFAGAQFDGAQRLALMEAADRFVRAADRQSPPPAAP